MSDDELNKIGDYVARGAALGNEDAQKLMAEVRRQRAVLDAVDASSKHIEAGVDRITEQQARYVLALAHLDDIIAAYEKPGIMPLMIACRKAKEWRRGDSSVVQSL